MANWHRLIQIKYFGHIALQRIFLRWLPLDSRLQSGASTVVRTQPDRAHPPRKLVARPVATTVFLIGLLITLWLSIGATLPIGQSFTLGLF